jgi:hypothetical protein
MNWDPELAATRSPLMGEELGEGFGKRKREAEPLARNLKICVHLRPSVVLLLGSKAQPMMRGIEEEGNRRWTRIDTDGHKKARPEPRNAQRSLQCDNF